MTSSKIILGLSVRDIFWIISLTLIGTGILIWSQKLLKSIFNAFGNLLLWIWSMFWSSSDGWQIFTVGIIIAVMLYITRKREPPYPVQRH